MAGLLLSAGCTDGIPPLSGNRYITDDNRTHQKWMADFLEKPKKCDTNPENPLEWTLIGMNIAATHVHEEALE